MISPTVLCTNEENLASPGSVALQNIAHGLNLPAVIVVPPGPQNFTAHRRIIHRSLHLEKVSDRAYVLSGTPVDCIQLAKQHIVPAATVAIIGVVRGSTLGHQVFTSAAVAAAIEAASLGMDAIVISQALKKGENIVWAETVRYAIQVARIILRSPKEKGSYWNVNLPRYREAYKPQLLFRPLDPSTLQLDYEECEDHFLFQRQYHQRPYRGGFDVEACRGGDISVTKLNIHDVGRANQQSRHPGQSPSGTG
jgi:5'-nucleotidase